MNQYIKLIEAATPYASRMTRLRNRIFGEPVGRIEPKSLKIVRLFREKPTYAREDIVNYYPRHIQTFQLISKLRNYGLYRDEHLDFQDEMKRLRTLRGKIKPKKGFGKQATANSKDFYFKSEEKSEIARLEGQHTLFIEKLKPPKCVATDILSVIIKEHQHQM